MNPARLRSFLIYGHIIGSLFVGTYLYSPLSANPAFSALVLFLVFPAMAASGLILWQQARITRWLKSRRRT